MLICPKTTHTQNWKTYGLGLRFNGSLFVCNNTTGQVLKMVFEEGKLIHTHIVASGLRPNGLKCHKGYVYVTQPKMPKLSSKNNVVGGLYRFKETETNVVVSGREEDPHFPIYRNSNQSK